MHPRAAELIESLKLQPHPEGGAFREIHRSGQEVKPLDGRPARSALTVIYFLLTEGEQSGWHRVSSDESWCWLEGAVLDLFEADDPAGPATRWKLGALDADASPVRVIPAGAWQAARSRGPYTLVACMVGPGFDFADFELRAELPLPPP